MTINQASAGVTLGGPRSNRSRCVQLLTFLAAMLAIVNPVDSAPREPDRLTVSDTIETTRVIEGSSTNCSGATSFFITTGQSVGPVFPSPDNKRYVAMLVTGDVKQDGVWLKVISGGLTSIENVAPHQVARLFTRALGPPNGFGTASYWDVMPGLNNPVWLDENRIAFFWRDSAGVRQIVIANVVTNSLEYATRETADVRSFCLSPKGDLLFMEGDVHAPQSTLNGFTVQSPTLYGAMLGFEDGSAPDKVSGERSVLYQGTVRRISMAPNQFGAEFPAPAFSSDGRLAIAISSPVQYPRTPEGWEHYSDSYTGERARAAMGGHFGGSYQLLQPYVLDMDRGRQRPLWSAAAVTLHGPTHVAWSPDNKSVVLAPTFLPPTDSDKSGLAGKAVAQVDVATGNYKIIPVRPDVVSRGIYGVSWLSNNVIQIRLKDAAPLLFRLESDGWKPDHQDVSPEVQAPGRIRIELRQDLNTPPALYAVDLITHAEKLVFDPNPGLRAPDALVHVERVSWTDPVGRTWNGLLYYPRHYSASRRYPVVLQTHGIGSDRQFTLYGIDAGTLPGLGPGQLGYAAQVIAQNDIAVLQVEDKFVDGIGNTSDEPKMFADAYGAAAEMLVKKGLADRDRIGLMGFSRSGWYVEYALTHSNFPYAAALVVDNMDGDYGQAEQVGWRPDMMALSGGPAFGTNLAHWLENAAAFSAERVRAPLQIQEASGGLQGINAGWEMFSRLRYLHAPVELYVIPDVDHGGHNAQNPRQVLASQQRSVDWWKFWLNGQQDGDASKVDQYKSWNEMRLQQMALMKTPRPPLLTWSAHPVSN